MFEISFGNLGTVMILGQPLHQFLKFGTRKWEAEMRFNLGMQ